MIKQPDWQKFKLFIKVILSIVAVACLFVIKIKVNNLLIAENGDTYEFFQMAQDIRSGKFPEGKRMILLPLILSLANRSSFVTWGRITTTFFYFLSIFLIYLIVHTLTKNKVISLCAGEVFLFNTIILDNSFYIMSDTLSTFLILLFFYLSLRDKKNYLLLSVVAGLAFMTRIENVVLFATLGLNLLLRKDKKNLSKSILIGSIFVLFILLKNFFKFGNPVFTAYTQDKAGFNINIKNIYLALTNFIFTVGGIWFLPTVFESAKSIKLTKSFFSETGKNIPLVTTVLLNLILVVWSPVVRLYSILVSTLIIWNFYFFFKNYDQKIKFKRLHLVLLFLSLILFLIATQVFGQRDYGMFKISKAVNILLSFVIFYLLFLSGKQIRKVVIPIAILISIINITIFAERFNVTRYKYATIKQATAYYTTDLSNKGKIGYMDESGLEAWFLNDRYGKFNYLNSKLTLNEWLDTNNIRFILYTDEMGHVEDNVKPYREYIRSLKKAEDFKSLFPGGYTKIIDLQ